MAKEFGLSWMEGGGAAVVGDSFLPVKSGYLKKSPIDTAEAGFTFRIQVLKKWDRRWFVFGVSERMFMFC